MTDAMLAAAGEDVDFAIVNTGGLRAPIEAGPVTYEELFAVMAVRQPDGGDRQVLVHRFVEQPFSWDATLDGRFKQLNATTE